ncbi:hypothetical protein PIB30_111218, partial [Stylosanthes scabra]|nr:hypothetical protein [Stylosanthes scabra]
PIWEKNIILPRASLLSCSRWSVTRFFSWGRRRMRRDLQIKNKAVAVAVAAVTEDKRAGTDISE